MMILQHQHNDHDREWQAQEESGGNCKYLRSRGSARPYLALSHQPPASFDHDDDDYALSSPRAESARAVTGRRNSYSGRGEDFLSRQPDFFTETVVTPERKVEKSFPRWEINRHVEG